jgi:DNA-directed RNA polymerase specialized sigma24 family protein
MRKRAAQNKYDGLLEPWKVRLIVSRARRLGFCRHDLEDAQQEVILAVMAFAFDPAKGAAESTALTAVIDNQLKALRRKAARYDARITSIGDAAALEKACPVYEENLPIRLDLLTVMTRLTSEELDMCLRLIQGQSIGQIARELHRGWHTVNRAIRRIRERFVFMGLEP